MIPGDGDDPVFNGDSLRLGGVGKTCGVTKALRLRNDRRHVSCRNDKFL